jgi:hypothetical protein
MGDSGEDGSPPPEAALSVQSIWDESGQFWLRVLAALSRALAFPLFLGLHWGIESLLARVVPEGMMRALALSRVAVFLVFLCLHSACNRDSDGSGFKK